MKPSPRTVIAHLAGSLLLTLGASARAEPDAPIPPRERHADFAPVPESTAGSEAPLAEIEPSPAAAKSEIEPIRVHYAAHAGCPDGESFVAQLLARTPRARPAADDELARTFVVRISAQGTGSRGVLTLSGAESDEAAREVSARRCGDVVSALALIAALIVDPDASTSPLAPPPAPAAHDEPPNAVTASPGPDRGVATFAGAAARRDIEQILLSGALGAELMGAVAPHPVLLPRVSLELSWQRKSLVAPSVRLSFGRGETDVGVGNVGRAKFVWVSGRLELCPIGISPVKKSMIRPCAAFEGGALTAGGVDIPEPREETRPLLAAAALARASFSVAGPVELELYGGIEAPLVRDEYVIIDRSRPAAEQQIVAHVVPSLGGFGGLAVALKTPLN